jgi:hypothetical protein
MQRTLLLAFLASACAFAQPELNQVFGGATVVAGGFQRGSAGPVQGAPYSATITNESVQTLADGNRIVQTSTGTAVRDSQGRTRQDAPLPLIGNMSPADAPHLVIIQDPVAQTSYTLNLRDKTAMKGPAMLPQFSAGVIAGGGGGGRVAMHIRDASDLVTSANGQTQPQSFVVSKNLVSEESTKVQTEDLGSQTMEGVLVNGTRTTSTIPAGQVGNDRAISVVTEVWTSPEVKTVVYSKRSDPRMGDQTFKLTNIVRAEPDPALFTIPADFKINDEPQTFMYKTSGVPAQ